jgi:hypothetical protein
VGLKKFATALFVVVVARVRLDIGGETSPSVVTGRFLDPESMAMSVLHLGHRLTLAALPTGVIRRCMQL